MGAWFKVVCGSADLVAALDGGLAVELQAVTINIDTTMSVIPMAPFAVQRSLLVIKKLLTTISKFGRANLSSTQIMFVRLYYSSGYDTQTQVSNVSFIYPGKSEPALKNIRFTSRIAQPGRRICET